MRLASLLFAFLLFAAPAHALTYSAAGTYSPGAVTGDLNITASNVTVRDAAFTGSLNIDGAVDNVTIERCRFAGPEFFINGSLPGGGNPGSDNIRFTDVTFTGLGRGVLSGYFCRVFNVTNFQQIRVRKNIVLEAAADITDTGIRGEYHYDDRYGLTQDCYTYLNNACGFDRPYRWRTNNGDTSDGGAHKLTNGCHDNRFLRDTLIVVGKASRVMLSSSATCDQTYPGCVGQWNSSFESCIFDMRGAPGSKVYMQGGCRGMKFRTSTFVATGPAFEAFDIDSTEISDCTIQATTAGARAIAFTNEYAGLPGGGTAGSLRACRNNVIGTFYADATLKPMVDAMGLNCGAPVPPPLPAPTDTARVRVTVPSLPAVITVVKQ